MMRWLSTAFLAAAALAAPGLAAAVAYDLPGNMPPGCTRNGANYTCPGGGNLGYNDTITISSPKPATVTVTGSFGTDNAQINWGGAASDLTLIVQGTLTLGYQAKIKGNITATAINDAGGGAVAITGNLTANGGNISLAYVTNVTGNVSTSGSGTITTPQSGTITGNVSTTGTGTITVSEAGTVTGNVSGNGAITVNQDARVGGNITGATGTVSVGYRATVTGTTTTSSGTINIGQSATTSACVKSTSSAGITLGYQAQVNSVCCGGACTSLCVANNSTYAMPPSCGGVTASVGSFTIAGTGSASTCSPQTLTITAKDSAGNTLTNYTGTIRLTTSTGTGTWSAGSGPAPSGTFTAGTANSGQATYTFATADLGVVKLRLANSLAQNLTVTVVDIAAAASTTTSAAITYRDNAFLWAEDLGNKIAGTFVAVAGRNHDMQVSLMKKDPTTGTCGVATDFAGTRNLKLWRTDNTSTWTTPTLASNGTAIPASRPAANNLALTFTAGVARFNIATTNIGKYAFTVDDDSLAYAAATISGSSLDLTVRPFTLAITGLSMSGTANPGGSAAGDSVFGKAGAPFSATVTAYRWATGADTDDDGVPDANVSLATVSAGGVAAGFNSTVALTPVAGSQTPAGGVLGTLNNNTISSFTNGAATATTLAYSEVGSFTLNTSAVVGSYLGSSGLSLDALVFNAAGAQQTRVGRFIPAGFDVSAFSVTHRGSMSCSPASTYTYMGEGMAFYFTLTAKNAAGAVTQNYTGSFAKFLPTDTATINLAGIAGTTMFKTSNGRLEATYGSGTWSNGVVNVRMVANGLRGTSPEGPFPNAQFGIAPIDSDGVGMLTLDLDTDAPANGVDRALLGQVPLRYGRLRLQNGISAANRTLRLPLTAQYWDSSAGIYKTNDLDTCTKITSANLSFGNLRKSLTTADAVMSPSAVTVDPTKSVSITLAAPGGGRVGSMDVAITLADDTTDASCLKTAGGWTPAVAATAGANLRALRSTWCGGTSPNSDPSARATWGVYRGSDGVLYQRENY